MSYKPCKKWNILSISLILALGMPFKLSLLIESEADRLVSLEPLVAYADETTAAPETAAASEEADGTTAAPETDENGETIPTEPETTYAAGTALADPDFKGEEADFYVIVRSQKDIDETTVDAGNTSQDVANASSTGASADTNTGNSGTNSSSTSTSGSEYWNGDPNDTAAETVATTASSVKESQIAAAMANAGGDYTTPPSSAASEGQSKLEDNPGSSVGDGGIHLMQVPSKEANYAINLLIPDGTLLYISGTVKDDEDNEWGYTNYAGIKTGYVDLSQTATAKITNLEEVAKQQMVIGHGNNFESYFQRIDAEGKPISAEEAASMAAGENGESESTEEETFPPLETDENGNPILETDEYGNQVIETNSAGMPVFRNDAEGNLMIPKDMDGNPLFETGEDGNPIIETDADGNPSLPVPPTESSAKKKSGVNIKLAILPFVLGMVAMIILEALIAGIVMLIGRMKKKKKAKAEAAAQGMPEGTNLNEVDQVKKKKGLHLPKLKLKLPKLGGKKKKKKKKGKGGDDEEE